MFRTRVFVGDGDERIAEFDSGYIPIGARITVHNSDGDWGGWRRYEVVNDWVSIDAHVGKHHTVIYQNLQVRVLPKG